jgi:hypothetical protein
MNMVRRNASVSPLLSAPLVTPQLLPRERQRPDLRSVAGLATCFVVSSNCVCQAIWTSLGEEPDMRRVNSLLIVAVFACGLLVAACAPAVLPPGSSTTTTSSIPPTTSTTTVPLPSAVIATIPVGESPNGLASDGTSIWVANRDSNTVSRIRP